MDSTNLSRRDFLKKSGKVALAGSTLLYFKSLMGCATLSKETREDVANIQWECNPILPIPDIGAYTGTNWQLGPAWVAETCKNQYSLPIAFNAFGRGTWATSNEWFRPRDCQTLIKHKVVPVIRYIITGPNDSFRAVIQGKNDSKIQKFAEKAATFGHPIVLVPWQCVNEPDWEGQVWWWSRGDSGEYKDAWVRMHEIFEKEGANKNVVWSTKMIAGEFGPQNQALDWAAYTPPKEYIDIIGWNCNSNIGHYGNQYDAAVSFDNQFHRDYIEAVEKYPTKPQMFWELGAARTPRQADWMDKALTLIQEKYYRVKGVMFDVRYSAVRRYDPRHTLKTKEVIRKHFSSGYFIGSALS
jgi:hypothetical protein